MSTESKNTSTIAAGKSKEDTAGGRYSFEKHYLDNFSWIFVLANVIRWSESKDRSHFISRLKLETSHLADDPELDKAINGYLKQGLKNVFYYRRKIIVENIMRKAYGLFTLIIVTCVPLFIFLYTDKAVGGVLPKEYNFLQPSDDKPDGSDSEKKTDADDKVSIKKPYEQSRTKANTSSTEKNVDWVVYYNSHEAPEFIHATVQCDTSSTPSDIAPVTAVEPRSEPESSGLSENTTNPSIEASAEQPKKTSDKTTESGTNSPATTDSDNNKTKGGQAIQGEDSSAKSKLNGLEAVGIIVSLLLTSLFAVHQVVSQWTGKRKFRAHFHQAQTDLMNIHFELEALAQSEFANGGTQDYDIDGLKEALITATDKCRNIVRNETKKYFELSSSPAVELSGIFSTSMTTANSLVKAFTSKRYTTEVERLREEVKNQTVVREKNEEKFTSNSLNLKVAYRKMGRLQTRIMELEDELEELNSISDPSSDQQNRKSKIETRLFQLEESYDKLLDEIDLLEAEIDMLNSGNKSPQNN